MTNEDKPAGFKTLINALKPIRFWLKPRNHPPRPPSMPTPNTTSSNNNNYTTANNTNSCGNINGNNTIPYNNRIVSRPLPRPAPIVNGMATTLDDLNSGNGDPFKRSAKARMSLPIMQQNNLRRAHTLANQQRLHHQQQMHLQQQQQQQQHTYQTLPPRSMGHIYLQHMGETKKANLPNEITSIDTIWALFVCAFPNMLTMDYMSQPHVKVYIYNPSCNIFYELRDIDDVGHESVLRIHQSDPLLALPQHYQTMRLHQPIVPPPKPRRMIPVENYYQQQQQQHHHHMQQQAQMQHANSTSFY